MTWQRKTEMGKMAAWAITASGARASSLPAQNEGWLYKGLADLKMPYSDSGQNSESDSVTWPEKNFHFSRVKSEVGTIRRPLGATWMSLSFTPDLVRKVVSWAIQRYPSWPFSTLGGVTGSKMAIWKFWKIVIFKNFQEYLDRRLPVDPSCTAA